MLAHAHDLISSAWTQHADARNAAGDPVEPWHPDAVSWSLLGALVASYERLVWAEGEGAALAELANACVVLADVVDSGSLPAWNDAPGRSRADVLAVLDAAAAAPRPEPQVPAN